MKKWFAVFLIVILLLPIRVTAQDNGLEQKYADEDLAFSYPVGWRAISINTGVMVTYSSSENTSDPDVIMLTFVKPSSSDEDMAIWPLDSDLVFLIGYIMHDVVSGVVEEGEHVEYGDVEMSTINENSFVSVTFEGESMSGSVTAIEHGDQRLFAIAFGTAQAFEDQQDVVSSIVQSVEFKD